MLYKFRMFGHPNISATHFTTMEFTKDDFVTPKGNCLVGVKADFDTVMLKKIAASVRIVRITIKCNGKSDSFITITNPDFKDEHEVVIRRGIFPSERTFGIQATKGASSLNYELVKELKKEQEILVVIEQPE